MLPSPRSGQSPAAQQAGSGLPVSESKGPYLDQNFETPSVLGGHFHVTPAPWAWHPAPEGPCSGQTQGTQCCLCPNGAPFPDTWGLAGKKNLTSSPATQLLGEKTKMLLSPGKTLAVFYISSVGRNRPLFFFFNFLLEKSKIAFKCQIFRLRTNCLLNITLPKVYPVFMAPPSSS